jgi:hypothetical protein
MHMICTWVQKSHVPYVRVSCCNLGKLVCHALLSFVQKTLFTFTLPV